MRLVRQMVLRFVVIATLVALGAVGLTSVRAHSASAGRDSAAVIDAKPMGGTGGPACPTGQVATTLQADQAGYTVNGDPRMHVRISQIDNTVSASWWGTAPTKTAAGMRLEIVDVALVGPQNTAGTNLHYDRAKGTLQWHMPTADAGYEFVWQIALCGTPLPAR